MGDVLHTLPALSDAQSAIPNFKVDWVIEPAFKDIPTWHPSVVNTIELPLRHWKKNIIHTLASHEFSQFKKLIQQKTYDAVIDAQGLLKSAWVTKLCKAPSFGFDKHSAREPMSSFFYKKPIFVRKNMHAIDRLRVLFAKSLNYLPPPTAANFNINAAKLPNAPLNIANPYLIFLHGTTWATKEYPNVYWLELIRMANNSNLTVLLPWGNEHEKQRAEMLAKHQSNTIVLPKLSIANLASLLNGAQGVISVDTGLGHLSAALNTPTISIYGPTNPVHVGAIGKNAINLTANFPCAPCVSKICSYNKKVKTKIQPACYQTCPPEMIWEKFVAATTDAKV